MGLPGAGKTTLASKLVPLIKAKWLSADIIRKEANDWDFSEEGRIRQSLRMSKKADEFLKEGFHVVADFVCPTPLARENFNADFTIWLDTIKTSRYDDTNQMFLKPEKFDVRVTEKKAEVWAKKISKILLDV